MSHLLEGAVAAALIASLVPSVAVAKPRRHQAGHGFVGRPFARHHLPPRYGYAPGYAYLPTGPHGPNSADPYAPSAADDPYNPYAPPGAAIRAQARLNQYAPGVTNELAPDNIATASGGPSGGVPGFSSH